MSFLKKGFLVLKSLPNSFLAPLGFTAEEDDGGIAMGGSGGTTTVSTAGQAIGLLLALTKAS